ncbi:unnamed protein product [Orchesella dallaii]|uniref:Gustatory receptor n=1 Tax=Orchesella dallaii TaxID=48710 RepID=A0ABP1PTL6_9HEXA
MKFIALASALLFFIFICLYGIGRAIVGTEIDWNVKKRFLRILSMTRYGMFLDSNVVKRNISDEIPIHDIFLGVFGMVALCFSLNLPHYNFMCILYGMLVYWMECNNIIETVNWQWSRKNRRQYFDDQMKLEERRKCLMRSYKKLKHIAKLVNKVYHAMVFMNIIVVVTYYSINLHDLFTFKTVMHQIKVAIYLIVSVVEYGLAAHANQMVGCIIVQFLSILILVTELRSSLEKLGSNFGVGYANQVASYFQIFYYVWHFLFVFFTYSAWWRKSRQFQILTQWISSRGNSQHISLLQRPVIGVAIALAFLLCSLAAVTGVISGIGAESISSVTNGTWWIRRLVADAKYTLFLADKLTRTQNPLTPEELQVWEWILGVIIGLAHLYRRMISAYGILSVAVGAIILWLPVFNLYKLSDNLVHWYKNNLENHYESESQVKQEIEQLCISYKEIRELSMRVNQCYKDIVMPLVFMMVFYYSVSLDLVFIRHDYYDRARLIFFILLLVFILILGADICRMMGAFQKNLFNFPTVSPTMTSLIAYETETHAIGIKAHNNVLTISYGLLGEISSTVITYFIVCAQYNYNTDIETPRV